MNLRKKQSGFAHAVILLVVVVGVIGAAGYLVYSKQAANKPAAGETVSGMITVSPIPETIKTKQDLDKAGKTIANTGDQLSNTMNTADLGSTVKKLL